MEHRKTWFEKFFVKNENNDGNAILDNKQKLENKLLNNIYFISFLIVFYSFIPFG